LGDERFEVSGMRYDEGAERLAIKTTPSCGHPSLKKEGEGKVERVLTIKKFKKK